MSNKHVLSIFHNSLGGGDSIEIEAEKDGTGWRIRIEDSSGYDYIQPEELLKELSVESLEKHIDGITLEREPSFVGGLVCGFLNANWPPDRKLSARQRKEAAQFVEVESDDLPGLAEKYRQRIAEWAEKHA